MQGQEHQHAQSDRADTHADGKQRVLEAVALHLVVDPLQETEKPHLRPHEAILSRLVFWLDEHDLKSWDDKHGVC